MIKKACFLSLALLPLTAFSSDIMQGEFKTLETCLASIQESSGSDIDKVMTDTPEKVSGFLENGEHFACTRKVTGTKGVYYEGFYTL